MKSPLTTLCYLETQDAYLMMYRNKKENDANEGKWIGIGGHFENGESPDECLLREVKEETGIALSSYRFRGIVTFCSDEWPVEYMFLYTADFPEGMEVPECSEGELRWVSKSQVMDLNLWEGDRIFLKLLLENHPFFTLKLEYQGEHLIRQSLHF